MFVYHQRVYKGLERERKRDRERDPLLTIELMDTSLNRLVFDVVTNE